MAKNITEPTHPPGRVDGPARLGPKAALVGKVLRADPIVWIERRRQPTFRGADGVRGPMTFRALAEAINAKLAGAGVNETVTWESVRTWYRTKHPVG